MSEKPATNSQRQKKEFGGGGRERDEILLFFPFFPFLNGLCFERQLIKRKTNLFLTLEILYCSVYVRYSTIVSP